MYNPIVEFLMCIGAISPILLLFVGMWSYDAGFKRGKNDVEPQKLSTKRRRSTTRNGKKE
jgi:hypothetical protein